MAPIDSDRWGTTEFDPNNNDNHDAEVDPSVIAAEVLSKLPTLKNDMPEIIVGRFSDSRIARAAVNVLFGSDATPYSSRGDGVPHQLSIDGPEDYYS